jgi:hypothetical protein
MRLSLDFDDTYTRDPQMWSQVIAFMRNAGHEVWCVTMRFANSVEHSEVINFLGGQVDGIICTNRRAKKKFIEDNHPMLHIDVWIDDNPFFILHGADV